MILSDDWSLPTGMQSARRPKAEEHIEQVGAVEVFKLKVLCLFMLSNEGRPNECRILAILRPHDDPLDHGFRVRSKGFDSPQLPPWSVPSSEPDNSRPTHHARHHIGTHRTLEARGLG